MELPIPSDTETQTSTWCKNNQPQEQFIFHGEIAAVKGRLTLCLPIKLLCPIPVTLGGVTVGGERVKPTLYLHSKSPLSETAASQKRRFSFVCKVWLTLDSTGCMTEHFLDRGSNIHKASGMDVKLFFQPSGSPSTTIYS